MSQTSEQWKRLDEPLDRYEVSSYGQIRNKSGKILKPYAHHAYLRIGLTRSSGGTCHKLIHRLVAEAFLLNTGNLPEVDHIDRVGTNNCISNLRWVSHKTNCANSHNTVHIEKSTRRRLVLQCDLAGNLVKEWPSAKEAAAALGMTKITISKCCRGISKTADGFTWKFKDLSIAGEQWCLLWVGEKMFEVSDLGRIMSKNGNITVGQSSGDPYLKTRKMYVHRLVALAFVEGDHSLTVNHKDGDARNNKASNLEWISQADNNIDMRKRTKNNRRSVIQLKDGVEIARFPNATMACASIGKSESYMSRAITKKFLIAGYGWEYGANEITS